MQFHLHFPQGSRIYKNAVNVEMFGTFQVLIIKKIILYSFLSRNYADLNYLVVMKEEEYGHNYRNNKGDVECEIRIMRRS